MPWGSWKSQAFSVSTAEKFRESGGSRGGVSGTVGGFGIEDAGGPLAALRPPASFAEEVFFFA
jgi:hypothetical protein